MASTSASRGSGASTQFRNAIATLSSENESLANDIVKALKMIKDIAVDLERDNESAKVKYLEDTVAQLLESYEDCSHHTVAIQSIGNNYQPSEELTNFKNLLEDEFEKLKASSNFIPQYHPMMKKFKEAVWNVHHFGEPMPGEEQEDVVMTSTQSSLLNTTCPWTGKPVTELIEPVRSVECKHIYEKSALMQMLSKSAQTKCPIAGCPKMLQASKVLCDPLLLMEIDELRSRKTNEENFTELEDVDSDG